MIQGDNWQVHIGSNLDVLPTLPDNSVDSIVTDPPYELGFMGKKWDSSGIAYSTELWKECLRVLKPGGHLLSFGGTRTWHRVAVAIEDSGFEVRDSIAWMYGSGFPKSLDISKAIDKAAGAEREKIKIDASEVRNPKATGGGRDGVKGATRPCIEKALEVGYHEKDSNNPATAEAQQWEGWGTALKPAFEPIVVARKPLIGTVAQNVLTHGTGGLNIDGSRIGTDDGVPTFSHRKESSVNTYGEGLSGSNRTGEKSFQGRWPSNVILDPYTAELLDEQSDASRFFYVAKASKRDRNEGLDELETKQTVGGGGLGNPVSGTYGSEKAPAKNFHPTVKPTTLMRYLVKLVTPPGGTVLDPFTGSGSTGKAAILEGFDFIGIELTEDYIPIIKGRMKHAVKTKAEEADKDKEQLF